MVLVRTYTGTIQTHTQNVHTVAPGERGGGKRHRPDVALPAAHDLGAADETACCCAIIPQLQCAPLVQSEAGVPPPVRRGRGLSRSQTGRLAQADPVVGGHQMNTALPGPQRLPPSRSSAKHVAEAAWRRARACGAASGMCSLCSAVTPIFTSQLVHDSLRACSASYARCRRAVGATGIMERQARNVLCRQRAQSKCVGDWHDGSRD